MLSFMTGPWKKALLMLASVLLYLVVIFLFHVHFGTGRGFMVLLPVITAAWLFGLRGGFVVGLMAVPCNRLVLTLLGDPFAEHITLQMLISAGVSVMAVGCLLGYFRDLSLRHLETAHRLERINKELSQALSKIKTLSGLIPICSHCKSIRDDEGYWQQLEGYLHKHAELEFTHGICPVCVKKHYPED